jgi:hypothetical protein
MSAGGVFKLIANDGKADRMIMATELLNQRIKDIMCMRHKQGFADPTPTLVDIERTHILFVNAHFKPFAAIGYEYNKVRTNSGQAQFGGTVQFSIPMFGDFFADMVVHTVLDAVSCTTTPNTSIPPFPGYIGAADQSTTGTAQVSATQNFGGGNTYVRYTYNYVTQDGTIVDRSNANANQQNFVRYCEYPGQRLFSDVKVEVNGNPLDEYSSVAMIFHQKFKVAPGKLTGWKRLVGQEVAKEAYSELLEINGASWASAEAVGLQVAGAAAPASAQLATNTAREITSIVDGYQTPKLQQPQLDMWIPLLFWFNKDVRLAIPSVSIPYGQRYITITLEQQSNLVFPAPGNLYLQLTVERFDNASGTAAGANITNYRRWVTRQAQFVPGSSVSTAQNINTIELYINNIFVNPEIHDIYIKRIGFSLIRVHRTQNVTFNTSTGDQLLSQLKWPIETIFVGLQPQFNTQKPVYNSAGVVTSGDPEVWRDWHRLTALTYHQADSLAQAASVLPTNNANPTLITAATAVTQGSVYQSRRLRYATSQRTMDVVSITAHGIPIFNQFNAEFFTWYTPYQFGGYNIITPEDDGAFMINFCLYPGTYQPSGHLNVSRAREFYIQFSSSYCSSSNVCNLLVVAIAINFLLISDGSAVLRYST